MMAFEKSEKMLLKAKELVQEHFEDKSINTAIINVNLALLYGSQGQHSKKKILLKDAMNIFKEKLPSSHPYIAKVKQIIYQEQAKPDMGIVTRILIA